MARVTGLEPVTFSVTGRRSNQLIYTRVAEGRGFEPPVTLQLLLISSQVPLTTQPPFRKLFGPFAANSSLWICITNLKKFL